MAVLTGESSWGALNVHFSHLVLKRSKCFRALNAHTYFGPYYRTNITNTVVPRGGSMHPRIIKLSEFLRL